MLNLPNTLSVIRIAIVPVFVVLYFSNTEYARVYAVLLYVLATFTDFLDGYLARKYNLITNLGKVLDPLGDKLLTFAVLICITVDGIIQPWVVVLFFLKEALMGLGGIYIHKKIKTEIPPSNMLGKTATVLFFVICVLLMIFEKSISPTAAAIMIAFALLVSFAAFVSYIITFRRLTKHD